MNDSSIRVSTSRSVSRAVARSRSVRAGVARRRRRLAALAACAGVIAGAPVAWFMAEPAAAVVASAAGEVRNLADLLSQRSPGTRTEAQLNKHARVAAKVRSNPRPAGHPDRPLAPSTTALVDLLQPPIAPVGVVAEASTPLFAPPATLNAILDSTPGVTSPPSEGGTTHLPTSEPKDLPPTSAVPEPQTWALMLMGFGLIGWRMRRRQNASKALKPAAN